MTVIAAKNPVAQQGAQFERDSTLQLDGQVGDTEVAIQDIRGGKGVGGADVETAGTVATGADSFGLARRVDVASGPAIG